MLRAWKLRHLCRLYIFNHALLYSPVLILDPMGYVLQTPMQTLVGLLVPFLQRFFRWRHNFHFVLLVSITAVVFFTNEELYFIKASLTVYIVVQNTHWWLRSEDSMPWDMAQVLCFRVFFRVKVTIVFSEWAFGTCKQSRTLITFTLSMNRLAARLLILLLSDAWTGLVFQSAAAVEFDKRKLFWTYLENGVVERFL